MQKNILQVGKNGKRVLIERLLQFKLTRTLARKGVVAVEVAEIDGDRLRIKKEPRPFTPHP